MARNREEIGRQVQEALAEVREELTNSNNAALEAAEKARADLEAQLGAARADFQRTRDAYRTELEGLTRRGSVVTEASDEIQRLQAELTQLRRAQQTGNVSANNLSDLRDRVDRLSKERKALNMLEDMQNLAEPLPDDIDPAAESTPRPALSAQEELKLEQGYKNPPLLKNLNPSEVSSFMMGYKIFCEVLKSAGSSRKPNIQPPQRTMG